jgi:hypothetical protein
MRRRVLTACFVAGLLAAAAPPVAAVDPIPGRPLPDEPPVTPLDDRAATALVVDLDGDGSREVVAATAFDELPGMAAIQAWWVGDDGSAAASNQVRIRRSATFDDRIAIGNGIRIDDDGMTGVRVGEPANLFTVRRDGREVPLVAAIGTNPELTSPCCLTIWEVVATGPGEIELRLAAETFEPGLQLVTADLDADGTDEMLVTEPDLTGEVPAASSYGLLTWDGSAYDVSRSPLAGGAGRFPLILDAADSDGRPGDDILLTDGGIDGGGGDLTRLTLRGSSLVAEQGIVGGQDLGGLAARILDLPAGNRIFTADGQFAIVWTWPRDGELEAVLTRPNRNTLPLAVLGSGQDTLVVMGGADDFGALEVFEAGPAVWTLLGPDSRAAPFASVEGSDDLATWTPRGLVPGGLPDTAEAFAFGGMLLTPTGTPGDAVHRDPIAILPGRALVGTAGADGAWLAMQTAPPPATVPPARDPWIVDVMAVPPSGALDLVSTASALDPEAESGLLLPTFDGVAPDPSRETAFIVGHEPMDATLEAPPGTRVWWSIDGAVAEQTTVGPDGLARIRLLEPTDASEGDASVFGIRAITPVGHAYQGAWRLRVYRQPPDLGIDDETPFIDLAPVVAGRTLPGSTLTVNGEPATVEADGSFSVPVDVGIVPTQIRIVVTDPVGNRTERLITRVWPVEYRDLPYGVFAVLALALLAGLLYVREADAKPGTRRTSDDEATFEEIGG